MFQDINEQFGVVILYSFCVGDGSSMGIDYADASGAETSGTEASGIVEGNKLSTKKPAMLNLPEEMTVMQIDCGTFHTGGFI